MAPYSNQIDNIEWTRGHILKKCKGTKFEYNSSGYRTKKNDKVHFSDGDKIVAETLKESELQNAKKGIMNIDYGFSGPEFLRVIDSEDKIEKSYVLRRDLQGNVIAITMLMGIQYVLFAEYEYDAWGNHLSVKAYKGGKVIEGQIPADHIARVNPFRWKGHYYDEETSFYYINGNYYDPFLGRMIAPKNYDEAMQSPYESVYALAGNNPLAFSPLHIPMSHH